MAQGRKKTLVTEAHRAARVVWARWVLARTTQTLSKWVYTDGCVLYLARDVSSQASAVRGALGPYIWRLADSSDALYQDCDGPSANWKAQGQPVKVWGLLAAGVLFVYILPEGESMNRWKYAWLIEKMFARWLGKAFGVRWNRVSLLQDHEKAHCGPLRPGRQCSRSALPCGRSTPSAPRTSIQSRTSGASCATAWVPQCLWAGRVAWTSSSACALQGFGPTQTARTIWPPVRLAEAPCPRCSGSCAAWRADGALIVRDRALLLSMSQANVAMEEKVGRLRCYGRYALRAAAPPKVTCGFCWLKAVGQSGQLCGGAWTPQQGTPSWLPRVSCVSWYDGAAESGLAAED